MSNMNNMNPAAMSLLQQQIFGQYAMMNGLLGEPPNKRMKTGTNAIFNKKNLIFTGDFSSASLKWKCCSRPNSYMPRVQHNSPNHHRYEATYGKS